MKTKRNNILLLYFLAFAGTVGFGILSPLIPVYARELGATGFLVGLVSSVFMIARASSAFLSGNILSRYNLSRAASIRLLAPIMGLMPAMYSAFALYWFILVVRAVQGVVNGLVWPSAQFLTLKNASDKKKTRTITLYYLLGNGGSILSTLMLTVLIIVIEKFSGLKGSAQYPSIFILTSILMIPAVVSVFFIKDDGEDTLTNKKDSGIEKNSSLLYLYITAFIVGGILTSSRSIVILFLNEYFHQELKNITFIYFIANLASFPFIYAVSHIVDRVGEKKVMPTVIILSGIALFVLSFTHNLYIFIVCLVVLFIGLKSFTPVSRSIIKEKGKDLSKSIGHINGIQNAGSIIGPLIAGLSYDYLPNKMLSFALFGIMMLFSAVLMIVKRDK